MREKKKKNQQKKPLTPEEKKELFKSAQKVKDLKKIKNPVKGQLFKINVNPKKGSSKDGRAKNLGKQEVVVEATGKEGFGKFRIRTSRKK